MSKTYEAQDSRHTYEWSKYGILVRERNGEWAGFYRFKSEPPVRLILTGFQFGVPPGELIVDFCTMGDIQRNILDPEEV